MRHPSITTRDLLIGLIAVGAVLGISGATRADADVQTLPAPIVATHEQRLAACGRRHRGDWPAIAGCKVRVEWTGSTRSARETVRVGWCESGLNPRAGYPRRTYQGAWQFDRDARHTYGWGLTLTQQIHATQRIHHARGWQPFPRCRPGGADHAPRWARAPRSLRAYG